MGKESFLQLKLTWEDVRIAGLNIMYKMTDFTDYVIQDFN